MAAMADPADGAVPLGYPLRGRFRALNSPAHRVPSHGTHFMGTTYTIDFVPVDAAGRSAPWGWRSVFASEPPERFVGFGMPVHAPASGVVALVHDGEPDHVARRSLPAGLGYLLGQGRRLRAGAAAIAGNHVVIALGEAGPYVLVAHLRRGSVRVRPGEAVSEGDILGACGNSGNSTQPHVHLQVTDSVDWDAARGLPIAFRTPRGLELPGESEVVDAPAPAT